MSETVRTVESLTGRQMVLVNDTRAPRAGEALVPPDRFNRRLLLCDPAETSWGLSDSRTGEPLATIRTRSFDDMIYFLGETLRNGSEEHPTVVGKVILFQTYSERGEHRFMVRAPSTRHVYFIGRRPCGETAGSKDVTGNVLSLLNQLYLLAQSDEFLRAPVSASGDGQHHSRSFPARRTPR